MVSRIPFGCVLDMMSSSKLSSLSMLLVSDGSESGGSGSMLFRLFSRCCSALSWIILLARMRRRSDCLVGAVGDTMRGRAVVCCP